MSSAIKSSSPAPPSPQRLRDWSTAEVASWLDVVGYPQYKESFMSSSIDGDRLLFLGTPDQVDHISFHLAELGVVEEDAVKLEGEIVALCEESC